MKIASDNPSESDRPVFGRDALRTLRAQGYLPPGPTSNRLVTTVRLFRDPLLFNSTCVERYGDIFSYRFVKNPPFVTVTDPEGVWEALTGTAGAGDTTLSPLLGDQSLLAQKGEHYLRARRLIQPRLRGRFLVENSDMMRQIVHDVIDEIPIGTPFSLYPYFAKITMTSILRVILGVNNLQILSQLREALEELLTVVHTPRSLLMLYFPILRADLGPRSPGGRVAQCLERVDALLFAEIRRRREQVIIDPSDVLSNMIIARDENDESFSDQELRDQSLTMILAGFETTAQTIALAMSQILARDDVRENLRTERERLGSAEISVESLQSCEYLDAVVQETMRLSPISETKRFLDAPLKVKGYELPPGIAILASFYLLHRRPEIWPNPNHFDPNRFIGKRADPRVFAPFGSGIRRCPGSAFAENEIKMVLSEVLDRIELRLEPGYSMRIVRSGYVLGPSDGVRVIADRRRSVPTSVSGRKATRDRNGEAAA